MADELNPAFTEALREMGRPTTPRKLQERGVKRLRSVGMKEISLLIERAINRTLIERTINADAAETKELTELAEKEFSRGLRALEKLTDSQQAVREHRQEMEEQLRRLRSRLNLARGFVDMPGWTDSEGRDGQVATSAFIRKLRGCLLPLTAGSDKATVDEVVAAGRVARAERPARQPRDPEARSSIPRCSCSSGASASSCARSRRVSAPSSASRRRTSTPESPRSTARCRDSANDESNRVRKNELMTSLFKANLELKSTL